VRPAAEEHPAIEIGATCGAEEAERGLSRMAQGLIGSEILRIASRIREMTAAGAEVCNLTVGDFSSTHFPIPRRLGEEIRLALERGETNYPPSDGVLELRHAIRREYERRLGLAYPVDSIVVASGARPAIYAAYRALLDPGETVVYPTPSWNNNHYAHLVEAKGVAVAAGRETHFLPTASALAPAARAARLLVLNTPLNPTGTAMRAEEIAAVGRLLVEENARRRASGGRPLYLLFDQVYRSITFHGVRHETPVRLVPECAPHVIFVDAISKAFCATGLRVGWVVGPPPVVSRMRDIIGHVGAWAPRAEQVATARFLDDAEAVDAFHAEMLPKVLARLEALHAGLESMRARGYPVEAIEPGGAIYLSARFNLIRRERPGGATLASNEDIRTFLLEAAGFAVVPFQAFGVRDESGWFRLSVGAVSLDEIRSALARLERALAPFRSG
jgi:aspartate aminotransferase